MQNVTLEICAGSYDSALAALKGGADRVELCSALGEGGLTPSLGLVRAVVALPGLRKHVLIRPRGGDFLYSEEELQIMVDDIHIVRSEGVDGVVLGALTADGNIDICAMKHLMQAAGDMDVTFHRAFDLCRNPDEALEQIVDLGCSRLLTSGQASSAAEGIDLLSHLVELSAGRIIIMPGCGVDVGNAVDIISATGAREIHASARDSFPSKMNFRHAGVSMGKAGNDEYVRLETSEGLVARLKEVLMRF